MHTVIKKQTLFLNISLIKNVWLSKMVCWVPEKKVEECQEFSESLLYEQKILE